MPPSALFGTLFSMGFKRKADASPADVAAAATARQQQEAAAAAPAPPPSPSTATGELPVAAKKKKLSSNPDAVRKRAERFRSKKRSSSKRPREAVDAEKAAAKAAKPAPDIEKEVEYIDAHGRKRKRKMARSRASVATSVGPHGQRLFTDTEKKMIVDEHAKQKARSGTPMYSTVANELQCIHPTIFGAQAPTLLTQQAVRHVVLRHKQGAIDDQRGRPPALPAAVVLTIIAAFTAIVTAKATIVSAPMLQPVAIACILEAGYASLINSTHKRGLFVCGLHFVRALMKERGWRNVKPQGDDRKLPADWAVQRWLFVLRVSYFVFVHEIPRWACVNGDETGIHFTQIKGSTWITKEQKEADDKKIKGVGDKRQFTLLGTTAANGSTLPHQVIVNGKTADSLPKFGKPYKTSVTGTNSKGYKTSCFVLPEHVPAVAKVCGMHPLTGCP